MNPRGGRCEEVQFVLVKPTAIWPASELVLEVIFIATFIAWQAHAASVKECLPACLPSYLPMHSLSADGGE